MYKKIGSFICLFTLSISIHASEPEIIKGVIPAAGIGTRFLPLTKAIPKEMVPVLNKPSIQYVVEECVKSGITKIFFITGKEKSAIGNYFDPNKELDLFLQERNKPELVESVKKIGKKAHFTYIRQPEPLGLGHAILMAKHSIGKEFFAILLPDDIIHCKNNEEPGIQQLINIAKKENANVVAVKEVPQDKISSYGIVEIKKQIALNTFEISRLVEKPKPEDAPSNLAIVGRYVLSHNVFSSLQEIAKTNVGELQLTDAINHMAQNGKKVIAYKIRGNRYDTGRPISWLEANINMALADPYYAEQVKDIFARATR